MASKYKHKEQKKQFASRRKGICHLGQLLSSYYRSVINTFTAYIKQKYKLSFALINAETIGRTYDTDGQTYGHTLSIECQYF